MESKDNLSLAARFARWPSTIGRRHMQIDFKGRNVPVTDEFRHHVERRLAKVAKQVSEFARLEIEIYEERNPRVAEREVAEATLYLKGATLRASERSHDMSHSLNLVVDELSRQVKRHRDKRRHRREGRAPVVPEAEAEAEDRVGPGLEPPPELSAAG
jgi:ribosome hibernation promoting factor